MTQQDSMSEVVDKPPHPTPSEILLELPLYKPLAHDMSLVDGGVKRLREFFGTLDCYCTKCGRESVFKNAAASGSGASGGSAAAIYQQRMSPFGKFSVTLYCTRDVTHQMIFYFLADEKQLQKIGQYPSIADLGLPKYRSYKPVLSTDYLRELNKAIGLASHGVGVGAFVYLRRIFESLIESARVEARSDSGWNDAAFDGLYMKDKIQALSGHLPELLVKHSAMYSILSKGIHELDEEECLSAFPVIRMSIEIILDQKLKMKAESDQVKAVERSIQELTSRHSSPAAKAATERLG